MLLLEGEDAIPSFSPEISARRLVRLRRLRNWLVYRGAGADHLRVLDYHTENMTRWIELLEREKHTFL